MEITPAIIIKNLTKKFGVLTIIENLNLRIEKGKITCILAPSGAGKTTLLRLIAGLDKPTKGEVLIDNKKVLEPSGNVGFMFQETSIFPWLTVRQNIEFGLTLSSQNDQFKNCDKNKLAINIAQKVRIEKFLDFYPSRLSGGEKQRVIIARSLVLNPSIILCDEPFSSLDEESRKELRELILDIQNDYSQTIIFITHNKEEAYYLGDYLYIGTSNPLNITETLKIK